MLLVGLAAGVIYVQTDYGELKVELSDPNARVEVRVNGQSVTLTADGKVTHIKAGPGELVVSGEGFETTAKSFNLKRGGTEIVKVTLVPKRRPGPADPAVTPKKDKEPVAEPSPAAIAEAAALAGVVVPGPVVATPRPKPAPFPEKSTLVEVAGWQVLTDATKAEMEKWLDDRKAAKHSVMWLDAYQIGDKPVFCAIAALDNRQADWTAVLDEGTGDFLGASRQRLDVFKNHIVSLSGYASDGKVYAAVLWHRGGAQDFQVAAAADLEIAARGVPDLVKRGYAPRVLRNYPCGPNTLRAAGYFESAPGVSAPWKLDLPDEELTAYLEKQQEAGNLPNLAAYYDSGKLFWTVATAESNTKSQWTVNRGLTAAELKTKTFELTGRGYAPRSLIIYEQDEAVRYCVVWVKEPPKPTPYPKGPTLIDVTGWQILTDATEGELQKWLSERRKKKHSVMWLDSYQVGDKPVFSAAAALDDREPGWKVLLDVPAGTVKNVQALKKHLDVDAWWGVSISGYLKGEQVTSASLWWPGKRLWGIHGDGIPEGLSEEFDKAATAGYRTRVVRPYSTGGKGIAWAFYLERRVNAANEVELNLSTDKLAQSLERLRKEGKMPVALAGYLANESPVFTLVADSTPAKVEWDVTVGLPASQLQAKAGELAKKGFRPSCVTAYPWDGAVRYCVVWLSEPPKKP